MSERYPVGAIVRSRAFVGSCGEFVGKIIEDHETYYLVRCFNRRAYWHRLHEDLTRLDAPRDPVVSTGGGK